MFKTKLAGVWLFHMSVTRSKAKKGTVTRSKAFAFHGSRVCHLSKYGIMFQHTLDLHVIRELALCQEFTNVCTFTINDLPQYFLDIDECRDGKSRCSLNGRCGSCDTNAVYSNTEGSYLCRWKYGFMVTTSSSAERPASLIEMFLRVITIQFVLRQILGLHLNMEEATHDQNLCLLILTLFQTL